MLAEVKNKLLEAIKIHQSGSSEEAQSIYQEIVSAHPELDQPWYLYGLARMEAYDFGKAYECLSKARALVPNNVSYALAAAQACYELEDWGRALELASVTLVMEGASVDSLHECALLKGQALEKLGRLEEAESCLRNCLEARSSHAEVHIALGCVFDKQGKHDWAIAAVNTVLQTNPKHLKALLQRGDFYFWQEKLGQAENTYRLALEAHLEDPQPHARLGTLFMKKGKKGWAKAAYKSSLEHSRFYYPAHLQLAKLFLEDNDSAKALEHLKEMKRLRPDDSTYSSLMLQAGLRGLDFPWVRENLRDDESLEAAGYQSCVNHFEGNYEASKQAMVRGLGIALKESGGHG